MQNSPVLVEFNLLTIIVKGNIHNENMHSLCSKMCFKHINEACHVLKCYICHVFVAF